MTKATAEQKADAGRVRAIAALFRARNDALPPDGPRDNALAPGDVGRFEELFLDCADAVRGRIWRACAPALYSEYKATAPLDLRSTGHAERQKMIAGLESLAGEIETDG